MYDALSRMYDGRNINRKMNLRAQLKGTKMSKGEYVQHYFTKVSQFKEKLSAIGDTLKYNGIEKYIKDEDAEPK